MGTNVDTVTGFATDRCLVEAEFKGTYIKMFLPEGM